MRRVLTIAFLVAAAAAFVVLAGGAAEEQKGKEFKVELDNAFGLIEGGDFKVAGVRAGQLKTLDLDRKTKRAIVTFKVTEDGFGSLRTDAVCNVAPQSLVGEYYIDCQPGKDGKELAEGDTIPVEQTTSTVPPDLVTNLMRRPYRERLRYIIAELGAAVAGNSDNLNEAIRRAVPALRETNRVLAILAKQNTVLADLARDADRVIGELADNKGDVSQFVVKAKELSQTSASRDREIAAGFRRLPTFLRELRPTMQELGATVDEQGPALRNIAASAGQIERLFENLPPFADASRPALKSLGEAAVVGRTAVKSAGPTVDELEKYTAAGVGELGKNLAIILEHLNDRDFSAEEDPRSPSGKGYTGFEALLQYVFDQAMSTNVHDGTVHVLKAFPHEGVCAQYADADAAREHAKECAQNLGPNAIGINFPDRTSPNKDKLQHADRGPGGDEPDPVPPSERRADGGPRPSGIPEGQGDAGRRSAERPSDSGGSDGNSGGGGQQPKAPEAPKPPEQLPKLDDILPGGGGDEPPKAPEVPKVEPPPVKIGGDRLPLSASDKRQGDEQLLDFLFGS